jgi:hypothetical protein
VQRQEEEPSDVSDVEDEEIVFMSVLFDRGELGVAIYNALTTSLKTLQLQIADAQELGEVHELLPQTLKVFPCSPHLSDRYTSGN